MNALMEVPAVEQNPDIRYLGRLLVCSKMIRRWMLRSGFDFPTSNR